ncbi:hypothetical protein C2845_PM01G18170 [Panicum miliaceum]|uniref:Uncharacterized protein n=1 Tax=Panicum miliaceum TaxID=4540 RepID=A0A3L6TRJ2_PANMI|nr:hypothetical protein C2845_PM01G18170 [Panicum miliaceum]
MWIYCSVFKEEDGPAALLLVCFLICSNELSALYEEPLSRCGRRNALDYHNVGVVNYILLRGTFELYSKD